MQHNKETIHNLPHPWELAPDGARVIVYDGTQGGTACKIHTGRNGEYIIYKRRTYYDYEPDVKQLRRSRNN